MKRPLHVLVFVLAMATALACAQMSGTPGTPPSSTGPQPEMSGPQKPTAPAEGQSMPGTAATPGSQAPDSPNQGKSAASTVDDTTLRQQVQQQLASDPSMKGVQASAQNGEVELTGTVASKDDKKKAKKLVGAIPGVRRVKEHLTVGTSAGSTGGSNEPAEAKGSTAAAPSTGSMASSASTPSTTTTTATSSTTNTAGSIAGNSGAASSTPPTQAAAAPAAHGSASDVEKAINSQIAGAKVQVKGKGNSLTLTGSVPREADRQQAENIAAMVAGPKTVIDQLEAASGGGAAASASNPSQPQASATGSTGASGSTATMGSQTGATATAPAQPGASVGATAGATLGQTGASASTGTTATSGTAAGTMSGQTGTTAGASTMPAQTATTATGAGAGSADATLQQQIQSALQSEPTLAGDHVTVNVASDAIDVTGTVNTGKERQAALRITQSYAGNRRVNDKLTVKGMGQGANTGMTPAGNAPGASETTPATGAPTAPNPSNPNATPPQTPRQ